MLKKIIIGFSGGMDSTCLLAYLLSYGYDVYCVFFEYASKHNSYEEVSVHQIKEYYLQKGIDIHLMQIDLKAVFQLNVTSTLLQKGGDVPEGHYEEESMKQTIIPGRNMVIVSILASIAETLEIPEICLGVHNGDHAIYPDCRKDFIDSIQNTVFLSSGGKIRVSAPFQMSNKQTILERCLKLNPPLHLSRTCYKDQPIACGMCGSCQERLEAFQNLGIKDPVEYE